MIIKLSNAQVTIKDELTWGDNEKIQQALLSGTKINDISSGDVKLDFNPASMLEAKYVVLECSITKIEQDGKEIPFTREWINNLSISDGDKLYEAVDVLSKKK